MGERHGDRATLDCGSGAFDGPDRGAVDARNSGRGRTQRAVDVTQLTGAAPFNSDDIAGHDSSASNDIVRTNDLITYRFSVAAVEERAANPVLTFTLPVGQQIFTATQSVPPQFRTLSAQPVLPSFCQAGSSVTPALADPPALITPTSKNSLQAQTVTCRLPEIGTETAST